MRFLTTSTAAMALLGNIVSASGPIEAIPAQIFFHAGGCSQPRSMELENPAKDLFPPPCSENTNPDGSQSFNPLGGGWEVQGLNQTARINFEITASPEDNGCGIQLELQVSEDGCFDLPNLNNIVFWDFCVSGEDCRDPMSSKRSMGDLTDDRAHQTLAASAKFPERAASEILSDHSGDYMIAQDGTRIPVYYEDTTSPATAQRDLIKRQSQPGTTYTPPQDCFKDVATCTNGQQSLVAICVDCVTGQLGPGFRASSNIDCSNSASPCPITFMDSVTVTHTVGFSIDIGFGQSGEDGPDGNVAFGLTDTFSVAVTKGTSFGLSIPVGRVGFAQYQPPADAGTVALVLQSVAGQNLFGGVPLCGVDGATPAANNMICDTSNGFLSTSGDDTNGQYSVVLQN